MNSQIKICQNCSQDFTIEPEQVVFYEKAGVPAPNFCSECRAQRRLAYRNERTLYKRKCDLCKKDMVAIYPEETPWPVYCAPCWWSDEWDAKEFARDYDSTRPFFDQFVELQKEVPRIGLLSINSTNSEYTNNSADNKNCYLMFAAENNEDSSYGRLVQRSKSAVDCAWVYDSELCYECIDCRQCYQCLFSERCQSSQGLLFCFDVRDSQDCILSSGLRHKKYCIENVQHTKEEYDKKKQEVLASKASIDKAQYMFDELKKKALVKNAFQTKCSNATGDYLHNCHDVKNVFDSTNAKNCFYLADAEDPIDCMDGNNMYYKPELCLDVMGGLQVYNCRFSSYVFYSSNTEYSDNVHNCESCFGCIGMKKSKYSILNKEYSPEEYKKLRDEIVEKLKTDGLYGNFFPPALSPFGYNETLAKDYYPMDKKEAVQSGFKWQDVETHTVGKETIPKGSLPSTIEEVEDSITKEVLACEVCGRNFRLVPAEVDFYRRMHLPVPSQDFECRHQNRLNKRTPRKLWHRQCTCDYKIHENTTKHSHHPDGRCSNEFETSYAPERPEIVYCEQCYQQEVV